MENPAERWPKPVVVAGSMGSHTNCFDKDHSPKGELFNLVTSTREGQPFLSTVYLWIPQSLAACLAIVIADHLHSDFGFLQATPQTRRPINKELAESKEEPTQEPNAPKRELPEAAVRWTDAALNVAVGQLILTA